MTVKINELVKRQTKDSKFTHFEGSWRDLEILAERWFPIAKPGYRDGVLLVPLRGELAKRFFCGVVKLQQGDKLVGTYDSRQEGEEPRKSLVLAKSKYTQAEVEQATWALKLLEKGEYNTEGPNAERNLEEYRAILKDVQRKSKSQCEAVDIILYSHKTLKENNENSTEAEWEIVSVNGRTTLEDMPIHPDTLIANHFQLDGGTSTKMTPQEFEAALKISTLYWKDKTLLEQ